MALTTSLIVFSGGMVNCTGLPRRAGQQRDISSEAAATSPDRAWRIMACNTPAAFD
jgi:hypothetical protein